MFASSERRPCRWEFVSSPEAFGLSERLEDVPWLPKRRYDIMREYLPRHGSLGHEMMKRTATVQVNLDFSSEQDAAEKIRTAAGLTSIVTALFASSPIKEGRPNGYKSYRAAVWLDMDEDRCGLLPFVFDEGFGFRSYAEWALDVPMFFLSRRGRYHPLEGVTFRRFLREGWEGERATLDDWVLHLSTLFPEVRLKRTIELRGADASTLPISRPRCPRCGAACSMTSMRAMPPTPWCPMSLTRTGKPCVGTFPAPVWRRDWDRGQSRRWPWSCAGSPTRVSAGFPAERRTAPSSIRCSDHARASRSPADDMLADFHRLGGDPARLVQAWELQARYGSA